MKSGLSTACASSPADLHGRGGDIPSSRRRRKRKTRLTRRTGWGFSSSGAKRTRGEPPTPLKSVPVAAGPPAILLYPPKAGDDCQRGRKRRPARGVFRPPLSIIPPSLFPLPSAPSSLAPHRGWGRGMTGLRARESGDISPGVGQFPKTHPMLLVSRFLSPHHAAAEPPQPSQDGTPPGDGTSDCHDQQGCWAWQSPVADSLRHGAQGSSQAAINSYLRWVLPADGGERPHTDHVIRCTG